MSASLIIWLVIVGLILLAVILIGIFHKSKSTEYDYIRDVIVPVTTPAVIALIGLILTLQSEQRQRLEAELQQQQQRADQQVTVMREIMVSQDRRDVSSLIAIDMQMAVHVRRLQVNDPITDPYTNFDEEAVFYFFGLHQTELVNVWASKGNLTFPRLWMANAFEAVIENVVTNILGADYMDPRLDPKVEAVMYKYFGGTFAGSDGAKMTPLLMDFHALLENDKNTILTAEERETLIAAFHRFQDRLHKKEIKEDDLINDLFAADGLVEYSYVGIFSDWYKLPQYAAEYIPPEPPLPPSPPAAFMEAFKDYGDNGATGTNTWNWVLKMTARSP
jgi:hypothetical protein